MLQRPDSATTQATPQATPQATHYPRPASHEGILSEEPVDDKVLIEATKAGDRAAFAELWNRHSQNVYRYIYRILRSHEDVEDVLQDTFFKAFVHLRTFQGASKFSTWLTRIAVNTALMELRRKKSRPACSLDSFGHDEAASPFDVPDRKENIEKAYEHSERLRILQTAIAGLRPGLREVVEMQRAYDCSNAELAKLTNLSVTAIKTRLFRAKRELRRATDGVRGSQGQREFVS